jgi:ACS family sodium-dependent inorganic phosphate cotransporter
VAAGIYLFGCVIYWFWASGEVQEWAKTPITPNGEIAERQKKDHGYTNQAMEMKE